MKRLFLLALCFVAASSCRPRPVESGAAAFSRLDGTVGGGEALYSMTVHGGSERWFSGGRLSGTVQIHGTEGPPRPAVSFAYEHNRDAWDDCWPGGSQERFAAWTASLPYVLSERSYVLGIVRNVLLDGQYHHVVNVGLVPFCPKSAAAPNWVAVDMTTGEARAANIEWSGQDLLLVRRDYCCEDRTWLPRRIDAYEWTVPNEAVIDPGELGEPTWTAEIEFDEDLGESSVWFPEPDSWTEAVVPRTADGDVAVLPLVAVPLLDP